MGIRRLGPLVAAIVAVLALTACGSSSSGGGSSGTAQSLLEQTFSSGHAVKSGVLGFALTLRPTGSRTLTAPITLSLGGPFEGRGSGELPKSDFTIGISALGRHSSVGVISTGTAGYVDLQGTNYQLPPADFQKLEQSFTSAQAGGGSPVGGLAQLGINPQHWLTHPSIIGTETINGASTTHIRAGVDVNALIGDLDTFLAKTAQNSGSSRLPSQIPQGTRPKIAAAVRDATADVWTGKRDTILRKLDLNLSMPVTGKVSTELGGMTSAGLGLTVEYAQLNRTQSIATPTAVHPYNEAAAKLPSVGQALANALEGSHRACIDKANGDVTKRQRCTSPPGGG